jgi:hypothetical protein
MKLSTSGQINDNDDDDNDDDVAAISQSIKRLARGWVAWV